MAGHRNIPGNCEADELSGLGTISQITGYLESLVMFLAFRRIMQIIIDGLQFGMIGTQGLSRCFRLEVSHSRNLRRYKMTHFSSISKLGAKTYLIPKTFCSNFDENRIRLRYCSNTYVSPDL